MKKKIFIIALSAVILGMTACKAEEQKNEEKEISVAVTEGTFQEEVTVAEAVTTSDDNADAAEVTEEDAEAELITFDSADNVQHTELAQHIQNNFQKVVQSVYDDQNATLKKFEETQDTSDIEAFYDRSLRKTELVFEQTSELTKKFYLEMPDALNREYDAMASIDAYFRDTLFSQITANFKEFIWKSCIDEFKLGVNLKSPLEQKSELNELYNNAKAKFDELYANKTLELNIIADTFCEHYSQEDYDTDAILKSLESSTVVTGMMTPDGQLVLDDEELEKNGIDKNDVLKDFAGLGDDYDSSWQDEVTPELKANLDEYEQILYRTLEATDLKEAEEVFEEFMEKKEYISTLDIENMSPADRFYFSEVMSRIKLKINEIQN